VTICTQDRRCLFGCVENEEVVLNEIGSIVSEAWLWLGDRHEAVDLDTFVVMPNYLHGILHLTHSRRGGSRTAPTRTKPLGRLIGAFKTVSTKCINQHRHTPGARVWQRGYYDHIIRDDANLDAVRRYIRDNPLQWALDRENPAAPASHHEAPAWHI